jgi:hypothetical protein
MNDDVETAEAKLGEGNSPYHQVRMLYLRRI